jgi:flagellar hook protein FlgE
MQVGSATAPPRPTDNVTVRGNVAADAAILPAFDELDASNTSNFSTSVTVYDSLGAAHQIDIYFRKNAENVGPPATNDWEWFATTDGGNVTGGTAGTPEVVSQGTMEFDDAGRLIDKTQANAPTFNPIGATSPQPLEFNFGTEYVAGDPAATGLDGLTQFTAPSSISFLSQLGYTSGDLSRVSIDSKGRVVGSFSNGQSRVLGQVVLANFEAPDNLMRVGGTLYTEQPASGAATIGAPATADRGGIVAGALEQSNVDLASEFIRMIAAQRGFQANSKTLSTADQLLAELMQIKR